MLSFNVKCAIQVLAELERAKVAGKRVTIAELKVLCGLEGRSVSVVMAQLRRKGWVESSSNLNYLIIDLTEATLYDLVLAIDETLNMGHNIMMESWPCQNRDKYAEAIELDNDITADIEQKLRKILLAKLFDCHKTMGHKVPVKLQKRAAEAKIVNGSVVLEQIY